MDPGCWAWSGTLFKFVSRSDSISMFPLDSLVVGVEGENPQIPLIYDPVGQFSLPAVPMWTPQKGQLWTVLEARFLEMVYASRKVWFSSHCFMQIVWAHGAQFPGTVPHYFKRDLPGQARKGEGGEGRGRSQARKKRCHARAGP